MKRLKCAPPNMPIGPPTDMSDSSEESDDSNETGSSDYNDSAISGSDDSSEENGDSGSDSSSKSSERHNENDKLRDRFTKRFEDTVTVLVGTNKKVFRVNKTVLTDISAFFRTALNGSWSESVTAKIELPEEDTFIFALFVDYAYSRRLFSFWNACTGDGDHNSKPRLSTLVHLYIMADRLQAAKLKNEVINVLHCRLEEVPTMSVETHQMVFDELPQGSPLRRFVLHAWMHGAHNHRFPQRLVEDVPALAFKLLNQTLKTCENEVKCLSYPSNYHVREE